MRVTLPLIALSAAAVSHALSLHRRDVPRVLEAPLERRQLAGGLAKRDSSFLNVSLANNADAIYVMNLTLGTPAQTFTLALDTGSSDLWVNSANGSAPAGAENYGLFNASASSSYETIDIGYNATYADGTNALGTYGTDTLVLAGATVKDFQFVAVNDSTSNLGIAGVGYNISTYSAGYADKIYSNLPYALAASGVTASPAYSLFLNSLSATTGTVLFGGVNKAKYEGELQTLPVVPVYNNYYSLAIALTEISIQNSSGSPFTTQTSLPLAVSLDSGSTFMMLPQELVNSIYATINATYLPDAGFAYVDCKQKSDTAGNITYGFSGATVTVSMSQLVLDATEEGLPHGSCLFGIVPSEPGVNILGDTFLRSAYVVYDLANNEISLANAKFGNDEDDILEIGTGADAVPGATLVPSAVSSATGNGATVTATEPSGVATSVGTGTVTGTSTGTAVTTGTASGTSTAGATAKSSSSSSGKAALPTGSASNLLSGLAGAGLLLLI